MSATEDQSTSKFTLTDEQWKKISAAGGIGPEDRYEVTGIIKLFRDHLNDQKRAPDPSVSIQKLRDNLARVTDGLTALINDESFYPNMFSDHDATPREQRLSFESSRQQLQILDSSLADAQRRHANKPKEGGQQRLLFPFIRLLDSVLESRRKPPFSRAKMKPGEKYNSYNFVLLCARAAKSDISETSVSTAMGTYITTVKRWSAERPE